MREWPIKGIPGRSIRFKKRIIVFIESFFGFLQQLVTGLAARPIRKSWRIAKI
jgi:hypothetical protein